MKSNKEKSKLVSKSLRFLMGMALVGSTLGSTIPYTVSANGETIDINVMSEWIGNNVQKEDLDISLYEKDNIREVAKATIESKGDGSYVFEGIAKNNDEDKEIDYSLHSKPLDDFYTVVTGDKTSGFNVYNRLKADGTIEGQVTTLYVNDDGVEIAKRIRTSGEVGSEYFTNEKDIHGYKLKEIVGEPKGEFDFGIHDVRYVYEKIADKEFVEGAIEVRYVDESGNEIGLRDLYSGEVGVEFSVEPKEITGYSLIEDEIEGTVEGYYKEGIHNITFVYEVNEAFDEFAPIMGGLVVKFVDVEGNEILNRIQKMGNVEIKDGEEIIHEADTYKTGVDWDNKDLKGYGLVNVIGNTEGVFTKGFTEVVYVFDSVKDNPGYEDFNDVIVKYVDQSGNEIAVRDRIFDRIGNEYKTSIKKIKGYTFDRVIGESEGVVGDKTVVVEYVYDKEDEEVVSIEGEVVVKHLNTNNKEIAVRDTIVGEIGGNYETEEKEIEGYQLVEVRGKATGFIKEGISTIEYIYDVKDVDDGNIDNDNENEKEEDVKEEDVKDEDVKDEDVKDEDTEDEDVESEESEELEDENDDTEDVEDEEPEDDNTEEEDAEDEELEDDNTEDEDVADDNEENNEKEEKEKDDESTELPNDTEDSNENLIEDPNGNDVVSPDDSVGNTDNDGSEGEPAELPNSNEDDEGGNLIEDENDDSPAEKAEDKTTIGERLPDTATSIWTIGAIGGGLIGVGGLAKWYESRKKNKSDK